MTLINSNKKNITILQKNKSYQNKTIGIKGEAPTPLASDVKFDSSEMPFEAENLQDLADNFIQITNNLDEKQKESLEKILKKILIFS